MRVQLAQQVQEILGTSALVILTERGDDVALRIGQIVNMGVVEGLDRHLPRHWKQRGSSWGWTAVMWTGCSPVPGNGRSSGTPTPLAGVEASRSVHSG